MPTPVCIYANGLDVEDLRRLIMRHDGREVEDVSLLAAAVRVIQELNDCIENLNCQLREKD